MNLDFPLLQLGASGRVRCPRGWSLGEEWSRRLKDHDLFYIWAGEGKMQLRDGPVDLKPGVCIWMRPGYPYRAEHNPENPLCVTYVHFLPCQRNGRPCPEEAVPAGEFFEIRDPRFFSVVAEKVVRLLREADRGRDPGCEAPGGIERTVRLVRVLLAELEASTRQAVPEPHSRFQEKIEAQVAAIYEQPELEHRVSAMAKQASLSRHYYSRVFREITGTSPRELIQEARMERACRLLLETPLSISEIAVQVGYADVFQFSRLFKRRQEVSPSSWRAAQRG